MKTNILTKFKAIVSPIAIPALFLMFLSSCKNAGRAAYIASQHPEETASVFSFLVYLFICAIICGIIAGVLALVLKYALSLSKEDVEKVFGYTIGGLLLICALGYFII